MHAVGASEATSSRTTASSPAVAEGRRVEDLLDLLRQRAGLADQPVVDLADGRDLRSRPAHEDLVGRVEVGANEVGLMHAYPQVARDPHRAVSRDADESAGGEWR